MGAMISTLEKAQAAIAAGSRELASPPFAACHAGVNYYRKLLDALQGEDFTFTLCCGDDAAIAHDALRLGFTSIRCDCPDAQFVQLQAMASGVGAKVARQA